MQLTFQLSYGTVNVAVHSHFQPAKMQLTFQLSYGTVNVAVHVTFPACQNAADISNFQWCSKCGGTHDISFAGNVSEGSGNVQVGISFAFPDASGSRKCHFFAVLCH